MDLTNRIAELYKKVQNVPYYCLEEKDFTKLFELNKGSCAEKNTYLGEAYKKFGLDVKYYLISFNWSRLPIPSYVLEKLNDIIGKHLALKAKINENWLWVDATWDPPLEKAGFPVTKNWEGTSDTKLAVKPLKIVEFEPEQKFKVSTSLEFYKELNNYLERIRKSYEKI